MMRNQHTAQATERQRGTVLMETVLAIPLFMIFIGGVMWLGEVMVTRQQLVAADRYVAWNRGLRYGDRGRVDAAVIHRLFFSDAAGVPSRHHIPQACDARIDETFDWSHAVSGQVRLQMRMPTWTRAMFNAGQVFYESGVPLEQTAAMQGRDKPNQRHVVVMRTRAKAEPRETRNRYGKQASCEVAKRWQPLAEERWPFE